MQSEATKMGFSWDFNQQPAGQYQAESAFIRFLGIQPAPDLDHARWQAASLHSVAATCKDINATTHHKCDPSGLGEMIRQV